MYIYIYILMKFSLYLSMAIAPTSWITGDCNPVELLVESQLSLASLHRGRRRRRRNHKQFADDLGCWAERGLTESWQVSTAFTIIRSANQKLHFMLSSRSPLHHGGLNELHVSSLRAPPPSIEGSGGRRRRRRRKEEEGRREVDMPLSPPPCFSLSCNTYTEKF